jgi:hypothetical protein
MKLLSDFDGVWTDPSAEAAAQGELLDRTLVGWAPETARVATADWLARARAACAADPRRYGWAPGGRAMSAFGDEDPFAPHSAILHYLHQHAADPVAAALLESIRAHGHADLDAFGGWAHAGGVQTVVAKRGPGILPAAAEAGRRLLAAGIDVVVVSNSGADKLARWFEHAGVPFHLGDGGTRAKRGSGPGALALRGGARKFVLDPARSDRLELDGVTIEVARPSYESALREERPDAVVGDVFSLDLALPLALRRREPAFAGLRLFWLVHPYTPAWLRARIESAAPEVECVTGGLPALADRLLAAR